ncbi:MAG TPA: MFS transporter [Chloroflexota bacterium]|nr:MFS transporter [Chloroflexota bacterium]
MDSANRRGEPASSRRWAILATIIAFEFVIELDTSIVNIALPTLGRQLHASTSELQWVVDSYVLVLASLLLFTGTIVDRIGGRPMLIAGAFTFGAASVAAAIASNVGQLIAMRALMGLGGALLFPATLFVLSDTFQPDERARAFSIWSAVAGLSFALGPTLGGWLVQQFGWSAIFWVNVPILGAAMLVGLPLVRAARAAHARPLDALGAVLAVGGLTSLLYAVIEAPERGWTDGRTLAAFAIASAALAGLALWESRSASPMLDSRLLGGGRTAAAATALGLTFMTMAGTLFVLTQYLQFALRYSPLQAGVRIMPVALVFAVAATASVAVSRRLGSKMTVAAGLALITASLATLSTISDNSGYGLVLSTLVVGGIGLGLAVTPAMEVTLNALPSGSAGVGSSVNTTAITLGGALGVAVIGSVLSSRFSGLLASGGDSPGTTPKAIAGAFQAAARTHDIALTATVRHALISASSTAFLASAGVAAAGVLLALVFLPQSASPSLQPVNVDEPLGTPAG